MYDNVEERRLSVCSISCGREGRGVTFSFELCGGEEEKLVLVSELEIIGDVFLICFSPIVGVFKEGNIRSRVFVLTAPLGQDHLTNLSRTMSCFVSIAKHGLINDHHVCPLYL